MRPVSRHQTFKDSSSRFALLCYIWSVSRSRHAVKMAESFEEIIHDRDRVQYQLGDCDFQWTQTYCWRTVSINIDTMKTGITKGDLVHCAST